MDLDAGRVYLFSGATGQQMLSRSDQAGSNLGIAVAPAGDADCDGAADVVVGGYLRDNGRGMDAGRVRVLSGATGDTLDVFDGLAAGDKLGRSVAGIGDTDLDGKVELIGGATGAGTSGGGMAFRLDTIIECVAPSAVWPTGPDPSLADLDGDGFVRMADAHRVFAVFGTADGRADLDRDGIVGIHDLAFVLDRLGMSETEFQDRVGSSVAAGPQ